MHKHEREDTYVSAMLCNNDTVTRTTYGGGGSLHTAYHDFLSFGKIGSSGNLLFILLDSLERYNCPVFFGVTKRRVINKGN